MPPPFIQFKLRDKVHRSNLHKPINLQDMVHVFPTSNYLSLGSSFNLKGYSCRLEELNPSWTNVPFHIDKRLKKQVTSRLPDAESQGFPRREHVLSSKICR
jgi:hypothetical protein